jgi:hypothetical protein
MPGNAQGQPVAAACLGRHSRANSVARGTRSVYLAIAAGLFQKTIWLTISRRHMRECLLHACRSWRMALAQRISITIEVSIGRAEYIIAAQQHGIHVRSVQSVVAAQDVDVPGEWIARWFVVRIGVRTKPDVPLANDYSSRKACIGSSLAARRAGP